MRKRERERERARESERLGRRAKREERERREGFFGDVYAHEHIFLSQPPCAHANYMLFASEVVIRLSQKAALEFPETLSHLNFQRLGFPETLKPFELSRSATSISRDPQTLNVHPPSHNPNPLNVFFCIPLLGLSILNSALFQLFPEPQAVRCNSFIYFLAPGGICVPSASPWASASTDYPSAALTRNCVALGT